MAEMGHKWTAAHVLWTSAYPLKADSLADIEYVRVVPGPDIHGRIGLAQLAQNRHPAIIKSMS